MAHLLTQLGNYVFARESGRNGQIVSDPDVLFELANGLIATALAINASGKHSFEVQKDLALSQIRGFFAFEKCTLNIVTGGDTVPEVPMVYFAQSDVYNGMYKIGCTRHWGRRVKELDGDAYKTQHKLVAWLTVPLGVSARHLERLIHIIMSDYHVVGEWYKAKALHHLCYIQKSMQAESVVTKK